MKGSLAFLPFLAGVRFSFELYQFGQQSAPANLSTPDDRFKSSVPHHSTTLTKINVCLLFSFPKPPPPFASLFHIFFAAAQQDNFQTRTLSMATMVPWIDKVRQGEKKLIMATPAAASAPTSLWNNSNGPDSPPVVFTSEQFQKNFYEDEEEEHCRNCHSTKLYTDWKQGDRVCTSCGVVAEERLRDDRPEWKDFNDAEDIVKKGSTSASGNNARSGLVPVDESKYFGGLQPTTLSKQPFGGHSADNGGYGLAKIQKRLRTTNRKLDALMNKAHKQELNDAKLERNIRIKKQQQQRQNNNPSSHDMLLQEEHDDDDNDHDNLHRMQSALHAEKWSLDRAILVHGTDDEQRDSSTSREELLASLDSTLQTAAKDLYTAYSITTQAAHTLKLPDRVTNEIGHRLVQYATQRDGLAVKGVSNRLSSASNNILKQSAAEKKRVQDRLREYNKMRQMCSLGAALIYLTSKQLGYTRSIAEICTCFEDANPMEGATNTNNRKGNSFIRPKQCSRAMKEIKTTFPEYYATPTTPPATSIQDSKEEADIRRQKNEANRQQFDSLASMNFADHFLQPLQLPPVAEACIKTLLVHVREEQIQLGRYSGTQLSTLCAALTFFVCATGSVMQKLAQQVQSPQQQQQPMVQQQQRQESENDVKEKSKARRSSPTQQPSTKKRKLTEEADSSSSSEEEDTAKYPVEDNEDEPFDVFSHAPIVEDRSEKQKYELRRMWDAWKEQMPWSRSTIEIEQASGGDSISRDKIVDFYKSNLYPRREELLEVLKDASTTSSTARDSSNILQQTPLATTLLSSIQTAAALMSNK
eukprot:scaffold2195_cov132-Cylindrotheca_fusiformis.AAC.19